MEYLIKAIKKKNDLDFEKDLKLLEVEEGLNQVLKWHNKTYKLNPKQKLIKYLEKKRTKDLNQKLDELKRIQDSPDFNGEFIITIEWIKNITWRANPKVYTNYGFIGSSISGCGYDKLSTATAQGLNSNFSILKLLCLYKDQYLKDHFFENLNLDSYKNSEILGYGSGYNIIPKFEGGVGVSSHENILKNVGLKMVSVSDTKNTNVYLIRSMTPEEKKQYIEKGY